MSNTESVIAGGNVDCRVVDADAHFLEPDSMWVEYVASKYRSMVPYYGTDSLGQKRLIIGGKTLPRAPAVPLPTGGSLGQSEMSPEAKLAGSDPHTRLRIMDSEGIDVNVIYPSTGLFVSAVENLEVLVALCRGYNNWARDFCSVAPERLLAPALVPQLDVFETLKEARRAVGELGLAGVMLRPNPIGRTIEDPAWEPLWSVMEELESPVSFHEGTGLWCAHLGADRTDNYLFQHMMSHPFEHMAAVLALIGGGILERHPKLHVLFLEAGCGWVPYWLERMDQHLSGMFAYDDVKLSLRPSEYFDRQCMVSADAEENAVVAAYVNCIGPDTLCWTTDFPHQDHDWRGMARAFMAREDLTADARRKVVGENAARLYRL